jgi:adenine-specific DNA-methyltransferase
MAKKIVAESNKIESIKHKYTRENIPIEELRDFIAEEDAKPLAMLYPRYPSLDLQLVGKEKDEQECADLAVPVVPIFIQGKIQPQAIIDSLSRIEKQQNNQTDHSVDFNGLPADFNQRVDFYRHEGHWSNRMDLDDLFFDMTNLAGKEGHKGWVQPIYFAGVIIN